MVSQCAAGAAHEAIAEEDGESSEVRVGKPEPRDREPNAGVEEAACAAAEGGLARAGKNGELPNTNGPAADDGSAGAGALKLEAAGVPKTGAGKIAVLNANGLTAGDSSAGAAAGTGALKLEAGGGPETAASAAASPAASPAAVSLENRRMGILASPSNKWPKMMGP